MPNIQQLLRRANRIVDDSFDNIDWIDWFNQCQNEAISEILFLPVKTTLSREEDGTFTLPDDYKDTLIILDDNVETYRLLDTTLEIDNEDVDSIDIVYNKFPTEIQNNPDQVPDIPKQFHDIYVFYGAMMAMISDEEHERYQAFQLEFAKALGSLKKYMDKKRTEFKHAYLGADSWTVVR